jgi:hypothetical protein
VLRIAGVVLLVAGVAGLAVGTFQYTRNKEVLDVGPLHVQAKQKETVTVPPLAAAGVAALGLVLVLAGKKK